MKMLSNLRVNAKFAIILALSAAAVVVAVAVASFLLHDRMISDRTAELSVVLDNAQAYAQALENEVTAGRMTRDQAIERFRGAIRTMRFADGSGYVLGAGMDGIFFLNPVMPKAEGTLGGRDAAGKPIVMRFIDAVKNQDQATLVYSYPKPNQTSPLPKLALIRRFRPWDAMFSTGIWIDDIEHDYHKIQLTLVLAGFGILLISGAASFLVGRDIVRPLGALKARMASIADGDLSVPVPEAGRGDEIGGMARVLETFRAKAVELKALQAEQDGLKVAAEAEKRRAMAELANGFEASVKAIVLGLSEAAGHMQTSARSMVTTAATGRTQTSAVVTAATEVSANVGAVAAAAEELSMSSREIGRQVEQASEVTRQAVEESKRTNSQVAALSETAQQIDEVVNLINSIAGQTNLLALNATIEAARAGESGKGFAVVASEVKSLASQTARATEEIRTKIQAVQTQSAQAVSAIRAIAGTIDSLNAVSAAIAAAVDEQSAATGEITSNIQSAAHGTQDVSEHIDAVGKAANQAGASADEVLSAADALAQQADTLSTEVDGFLSRVRAA
jgi:methyl-accepting chemotaxis protein